MAAFVSSARPISQILPGDFDLFPSSSSSSSTSSTTLKPRPQGHYRPHSTLYRESAYIEVEEKPARLLRRATSLGGLQRLPKMNLGLTLKSRRNVNVNVQSPSVPQFGPSSPKVSLSLSHKPRLAKTITHVTKSPPSSATLKKKRSMISLFSTASDVSTSSPTEPTVPSPLGARPVMIPPSIPEDSTPKTFTKPKGKHLDYDPSLPPFKPSSFSIRQNMKLHPYQRHVPYMQAYDQMMLESDRYSDLLLQRLSKGSPSFTDFKGKNPSTALDLGCGEGHWIVYASSIWKDTQFTGFDMMNYTTPTFKSIENAHFVQGDFVRYRLPFPDNSFDYVRLANLYLCVPRSAWAKLFGEVRRVMANKGRVEIIDDQMFFPYSRPPVMKEPPDSAENSTSDSDSDRDRDLDGETLHGYGSGEDSTFNSEGTCVSSFEDDDSCPLSSLPTSETVRPIYRSRSSSLDKSETRPATDPNHGQHDYSDWEKKACASRRLEATFHYMLLDYGLFPQPAASIAALVKHYFGQTAGKTRSFDIKLAEYNSPIAPTRKETADIRDAKDNISVLDSSPGTKKKPWSTTKMDRDRKKSKKKDKDKDHMMSVVEVPTDFLFFEPPIPESVRPKAAKKLGLDINISPPTPPKPIPIKEMREQTPSPQSYSPMTSSPVTSTVPFPEPFPEPVSSSPIRSNIRKAPNAKMAALFGVSYSELVRAAAEAARERQGLQKPLGLLQSPGLLIGDGEYMAIDPFELEMHACKYIHTLLGCRLAIALFVSKHRDEDGMPLMDRQTFDDLIWDYETFRWTRLGWPSGNAFDQNDDESDLKDHRHRSSVGGTQDDEPVPIRKIRVYEGRKADDEEFLPVPPISPL